MGWGVGWGRDRVAKRQKGDSVEAESLSWG
jgi:hypothetical protein